VTSTPFLTSGEEAAFRAARNFGLFFRLSLPVTTDGDMTVRIWAGVGNYPVRAATTDTPFTGMESIDAAGDIYYGAGLLSDDQLPALEILLNGLADRVDFSLNSIPAQIISKIDESAPSVKGRDARLGMAPLDDNWQPVTPIKSLWFGIADFWSVKMDALEDDRKPAIRQLILSVGSGLTGRSRPRLVSFTDAQQRIRYPTDAFFSRVTRYVTTYTVKWPDF
jgi:hypothetical protein